MHKKMVSLTVLMFFLVIAVTGILAFILPFQLNLIGLHILMGFLFLPIIGLHIRNNWQSLCGYTKSKSAITCFFITLGAAIFIFLQPEPVKAMLKLSNNKGPALERFEIKDDSLEFSYSPQDNYKMSLKIKAGAEFTSDCIIAVWVENQSSYHIKTLYSPTADDNKDLPFWSWKKREYLKAKKEAENEGADAVTSATPNASFAAKDYIIPDDQNYTVLVEINLPDDEPSMIYSVNVDNSKPVFYQSLIRLGIPEKNEESNKEEWLINYNIENLKSSSMLIDSAILVIERTSND